MRELRNTKIIAVDHGYGNMKTANTVTPTGIKAYETEPIFTGNILEYNGIYYRIGEGHKEFIPDKAMDEEYYLLTLMAIAREFVVALPVELDKDSNISLLQDFIKKNFVDMGMCADFAIHDTDGHNPHAHILLTVRPLNENGTWQYKTEK